jgi:hypothetical protein
MSKYDAELRRRLLEGDPLSEIRKWFIHCMAREPRIKDEDFTELERDFWADIVEGFEQWKKAHRGKGAN